MHKRTGQKGTKCSNKMKLIALAVILRFSCAALMNKERHNIRP